MYLHNKIYTVMILDLKKLGILLLDCNKLSLTEYNFIMINYTRY